MAKTLAWNVIPTHDEISARAYEIYLREGCNPGRDLDNWLKAEAELRSNGNGNSGNGHPSDANAATNAAPAPAARLVPTRRTAKR